MSKVTKLALPRKGVHTYFVASDWHLEVGLHEPSLKILLKLALKVPKKQRRLIINGDFIDLPEFMPRSKDFKRHIKSPFGVEEYFIPALEAAFAQANDILDLLQGYFNHITFISGNHDWRCDNFGREFAPVEYRPYFNLRTGLRLKERGIGFVDYNHWLDIGNVSITHGMYHGSTCLKKHYEAAGRSVIFGHIHQFEAKSFTRRGDTVMAWSLPCMAMMAPAYLKGRENNWTNGFGILNMRPNGQFNYNTFTIWKDKLVTPFGEVISAA